MAATPILPSMPWTFCVAASVVAVVRSLLAGVSAAAGSDASTLGVQSITLVRGTCFGWCPAYTFTIASNGQAVYDGSAFVQLRGRYVTNINVRGLSYGTL